MADTKLVDLTLLPSAIVATDYIYVERPVGTTPYKASGDLITAATLQTARTINGTAFDGSANITVAAAAGTLTGVTLAAGVTASSLLSAAGGAFGTAAFTAAGAYDPAGSAAAAQAASQPVDTDLTAIAALTPSNDDLLQRKAGAWTNRTPAQVKTDLALTSSDVGLGNVTNTAQTQAAIVPNTAPAAGEVLVGNAGGTAYAKAAVSGDATLASTGVVTLATVNGNVGTFGSATAAAQVTVNAKGLVTAAVDVTVTPAVGSITGLGTGVATALAVNVGTAGAPVVNGGALGTPSSGVATNLTGTAAGLTAGTASAVAVGGITGLGTGVATALAINVGSAGAPVVLNGAGGTPSSLTLTNATGLPPAGQTTAGRTFAIGFGADGGGSALSTGALKTAHTAPVGYSIVGYNISLDTGTATVKFWKIADGTAIPTITNVINTSGVAISSGTHVRSSTVSDFTTTTITAGDIIMMDLTAVSGATWIAAELEVTKS